MNISFFSKEHELAFWTMLCKMKCADCYHAAVAYLLTLDSVVFAHVNCVFNFENDSIKPAVLRDDWQTGTSLQTCRLAFNLWNGYSGYSIEKAENYTVENIFSYTSSTYAPYYWEAIKLRYDLND